MPGIPHPSSWASGGERYGWIPQPDEFEDYWGRQADPVYAPSIREAVARGLSETELEMEVASDFLDGGGGRLQVPMLVDGYLSIEQFD